jgi:NitT/TauT family transport system ATP-binding protein
MREIHRAQPARRAAPPVGHQDRPVEGVNTEVGYITQDDNLLPWRSVRRNVEFGLELRGTPKRERRERAAEFVELVGLGGFEDHYPHELSGGMRKRASIVRTLAYDSAVVLMDEPFGPLDAQTRVILQDELLKLWDRQRPAVLFVTHDLVEAIALSDRILTFTGRPGTIKREYEVGLPRPRDVFHIHDLPRFKELYDALWDDIRVEIARTDDKQADDKQADDKQADDKQADAGTGTTGARAETETRAGTGTTA